MGVPALFRWLSTKYPKIVSPVTEEKPKNINGIHIPVDLTKENPNGTEFDNLYLDLNGIVHPCTHPEDKPAPPTEEAMMVEIFNYLDRIMSMIRPRKLLYIAIDGVAPRAKMNQQRSRRFKAGLEARLKKEALMKEKLSMEEAKQAYEDIKANGGVKEAFDSNCITPGTPFMDLLSASLKYYLVEKLNTDQGWQQLNVILSDASVPGEGEHKIMDYIRRMRLNPDYDPNTEHVMYGLDADLIMLSLATHEPRFKLLREDVSFGKSKGGCTKCGRMGHTAANCRARGTVTAQRTDPDSAANPGDSPQKPFILLHINVLREYLAAQLRNPDQIFPFDLENAIDDWVFLIFFVGNDFLPHLPSLEIREGAIDRLIEMWKRTLTTVNGYLTHNGEINMPRVKLILDELAGLEDEIFRMRGEREEHFKQKKAQNQDSNQIELKGKSENENREVAAKLRAQLLARKNGATPPQAEPVVPAKRSEPEQDSEENSIETTQVNDNTTENEATESKPEEEKEKEKETERTQIEQEEKDNADTIKFHEPGYKKRYYESKFGIEIDDIEFRKSLAASYMEGLVWVMRYYYQGCASWKWFYPYHYPPFASDLTLLDQNFTVEFNRGIPLKPFEQLMGVLPADSKMHLPDPFHFLMENPESNIIDFYPTDFEQDMNGKKFAWQATVLLPFIEESRLLDACNGVYPHLTEEETKRNSVGNELLFLGSSNPMYPQIVELYTVNASDESILTVDTKTSKGVSGTIAKDSNFVPHSTYPSPLQPVNKTDIHNERAFCALYKMVQPPESFIYPAQLLPGVQLPRRVLNNFDIANTENNASRSKRNGNDYSRHEYFPGRDSSAGYGAQRDDHYVNHDLEPQVYKAPRNNHSQSDRGGYRGGYRGQGSNQYNNYGQHHGGHQQGYHNNSGQRYQNNQYGHGGNQNAGYSSHNNQGRGNYHYSGGNNNAGYQSNQYQSNQQGYHPGPYASQSHHQGGGSYNNSGGYSHNNPRGRGGRGNYRGRY